MSRGKKFFSIFMILCLSMVSTACQKSSEPVDNTTQKKNNKIQIGISFDSFVIERWEREKDVFVSIAKELGAEVNVQNANGDSQIQKEQIEYFIEKKMDVILIVCMDAESIRDSIVKAKDNDIKVVAYDRLIKDTPLDLYISFDNEAVGTLMGTALIENGLKQGDSVLMLGGPLTDNNVNLVESGFKKVMSNHGITILDSIHVDGWKAEIASTYIYENLDTVMKAKAIMCGNDNIASQVIHALAEKRQAGNIMVVGQDADLEACQCIVEGTQLMTVYKPVEKLAKLAAEYAVMLGRGDSVGGTSIYEIDNGEYKVPYIKLEPISVTEKNMNEVIIEEGFHLKEDVYLNVPKKMPK